MAERPENALGDRPCHVEGARGGPIPRPVTLGGQTSTCGWSSTRSSTTGSAEARSDPLEHVSGRSRQPRTRRGGTAVREPFVAIIRVVMCVRGQRQVRGVLSRALRASTAHSARCRLASAEESPPRAHGPRRSRTPWFSGAAAILLAAADTIVAPPADTAITTEAATAITPATDVAITPERSPPAVPLNATGTTPSLTTPVSAAPRVPPETPPPTATADAPAARARRRRVVDAAPPRARRGEVGGRHRH